MGFNGKKPKPKKPANQGRINIRLLACVVLGWIAIEMLRNPEEEVMPPALRIGVAVAFLAFAVGIVIHTLWVYYYLWSGGMRNIDAYQDEDKEDGEDVAEDGDENEECDDQPHVSLQSQQYVLICDDKDIKTETIPTCKKS